MTVPHDAKISKANCKRRGNEGILLGWRRCGEQHGEWKAKILDDS
jgi:hypothetical protein